MVSRRPPRLARAEALSRSSPAPDRAKSRREAALGVPQSLSWFLAARYRPKRPRPGLPGPFLRLAPSATRPLHDARWTGGQPDCLSAATRARPALVTSWPLPLSESVRRGVAPTWHTHQRLPHLDRLLLDIHIYPSRLMTTCGHASCPRPYRVLLDAVSGSACSPPPYSVAPVSRRANDALRPEGIHGCR